MKTTIIESPYFVKGNPEQTESNRQYLYECMKECMTVYKEAPYGSHGLFTHFLDDNIPEERAIGIEAGLVWGKFADKTVVYIDRGISEGMKMGIARAEKEGRPVYYRQLGVILFDSSILDGIEKLRIKQSLVRVSNPSFSSICGGFYNQMKTEVSFATQPEDLNKFKRLKKHRELQTKLADLRILIADRDEDDFQPVRFESPEKDWNSYFEMAFKEADKKHGYTESMKKVLTAEQQRQLGLKDEKIDSNLYDFSFYKKFKM